MNQRALIRVLIMIAILLLSITLVMIAFGVGSDPSTYVVKSVNGAVALVSFEGTGNPFTVSNPFPELKPGDRVLLDDRSGRYGEDRGIVEIEGATQ